MNAHEPRVKPGPRNCRRPIDRGSCRLTNSSARRSTSADAVSASMAGSAISRTIYVSADFFQARMLDPADSGHRALTSTINGRSRQGDVSRRKHGGPLDNPPIAG
jgi:hypothetical protein